MMRIRADPDPQHWKEVEKYEDSLNRKRFWWKYCYAIASAFVVSSVV
jgi:hypothetical protein